jgi:iron(III) transport system ATP-binding protein
MANRKVLELKNITKHFGDVIAVDRLSISAINEGEFVTFLGPSGCGKTTLLRMIGGFYYPTEGEVIMHGKSINNISPDKRKTSMVFQNYALFPHMTVFGNISYGLKLRKLSKEKIKTKVKNILKVVQLEGLDDRKPTELSGGQQQRVALARCIVIEPEIILLDEPLSNLDANLRVTMRQEIRNIQKSLNLTTIFVTHDQEEAMSMSDRIIVMNEGRIEQIGTPTEIYEKPATLFVARFIGYINLIKGRIDSIRDNIFRIQTSIGLMINTNSDLKGMKKDDDVTLVIRPESATDGKKSTGVQKNNFSGKILDATYIGSIVRYNIEIKGIEEPFILDVSNPEGKGIYSSGENVIINLPEKFHCIKQ